MFERDLVCVERKRRKNLSRGEECRAWMVERMEVCQVLTGRVVRIIFAVG
jgi:hypothetical protein